MSGVVVREHEGVFVVCFNDRELRGDNQIHNIGNDLTEVLTSASAGMRLLLDFQDVETLTSLMLGELVTLNKKALQKGVFLQLCRLSSDVMRIVKTCHLHRVFEILDEPPV